MIKETSKVTVVANGFQADYIVDLVKGLSEFCSVDLIGSSMYMKYSFDKNVKLLNLRGSHDENVSVINKGSRNLRYYLKLISYLFRSEIRIVHIQWLRFFFMDGVIISLLARSLGKRVFYTAHDVIPYDSNTFLNRLLFRVIYRCQNTIIVHTEYIGSRLIEEYRVPARRIRYVKHGVYAGRDSLKIDYKDARKKLEIDGHDFVILFFGIIRKYKGLELILQAFNELRERTDHVKLVIAGKISRDYQEEYDHILSGSGLDDIIIIPRFIKEDEVEILFRAANITVLPYFQASQSGVLFLSYAFGVPVVGPDLGGFPADIESGKTGLIFTPEDKESLTQSLLTAKEVFGRSIDTHRQYIRHFAERNYSWRSSCMKLCALYQGSDHEG
jgi:D-inositol-3-phosphate glycosyltransferase